MIDYKALDENYWRDAKDNALTIFKTDKLEIGILEISPGVRLPKEAIASTPRMMSLHIYYQEK